MIPDSGGVFKVTAFDPNAVQKAYDTAPYQEVKVYHSIKNVKPSDLNTKFIFTEDETVRAMMIVGVTTDDLIKMSDYDKRKIPGTPQIQRKIIEELEDRRIKTFSDVVKARNNLLNAKKAEKKNIRPNIDSKVKNQKVGYEKLKQMQLNTLISYQNRKKTLQNSEESAAIRMSELKKAKTIELQKRKIEYQKKFRAHTLKMITNKNSKESENKIEQLKNQKMQEIQKSKNELNELEESITNKKQQKEKQEQIEALKMKISQEETNLKQTIESMKQSNDNKFLKQINELSNNSNNNSNAMMQFRMKEEMKMLIMKEKEQFLFNQKEELEKKLLEKDARIEANLKLISSQKMKHIRENRIILRRRSQSAAATVKMLEQKRIEKIQKSIQRQEEAIERAKALKNSKNIILLEKAGNNWMKQKNGVNKAKKVTIQNHYKNIEKVEKTIERQEEIKHKKDIDEIKKIKEFRKNTIIKIQQKEEYDEFKKNIIIDSDADPVEIAQKYKVDLDSVKKMQNEIDSSNIIIQKKIIDQKKKS